MPSRPLLLCAVALLLPLSLAAQPEASWQSLCADLLTDGDEDEETRWTESYELLSELADHPLDLNRATREELEQLPFLTSEQVMGLMEYLDRYGPMRSLGELRMVKAMDYRQLQLLPFFVYVGMPAAPRDTFPTLATITGKGRHQLSADIVLPFNERKGDRNGYLGYRYRHWLRYDFSMGQRVRAGLVGAQDAGEPFFAHRNSMGYDYYSYYLQLKRWGCVQNLIVGRYKYSTGMGLVMGSSFSLGKLSMLMSLGRPSTSLRPHVSRSEADYLQGAAATLRLSNRWQTTVYASLRSIDATPADSGRAVSTLITNGYHRTPTEMAKKHNTRMTDLGVSVSYRKGALHLQANMAYTALDLRLQPNRTTRYRQHYAHGSHFANYSLDYSYTTPLLALTGETAINADGALATLHSLSAKPASDISLLLVQRFFSYRYTTLRGHAFSEGGHTQNESGIYGGISWTPLRHLRIEAYTDWSYFPWARYQAAQPSYANDHLLSATYEHHRWTLNARYRLHRRQRDNDDKTALEWRTEHRARLSFGYNSPPPNDSPASFDGNAPSRWSLLTQIDASHVAQQASSAGWMASQRVTLRLRWLQATAVAAYFHTDNYDSRLYLYERQPSLSFSVPSFHGEGMRLSAFAQADVTSRLRLTARWGYTRYFDRSTIGTGYQRVFTPWMADTELCVRWRL